MATALNISQHKFLKISKILMIKLLSQEEMNSIVVCIARHYIFFPNTCIPNVDFPYFGVCSLKTAVFLHPLGPGPGIFPSGVELRLIKVGIYVFGKSTWSGN